MELYHINGGGRGTAASRLGRPQPELPAHPTGIRGADPGASDWLTASKSKETSDGGVMES